MAAARARATRSTSTTPPADGPFATRPPRGAAEVVLYTPEHDGSLATLGVAGVRAVVDLWAERTAALLARPEVAYVLVFENRGAEVGATISHPHGQIYGFPAVPPLPAREAAVAAAPTAARCASVVPAEVAAGDAPRARRRRLDRARAVRRRATRSPRSSRPAPTSPTSRTSTTPVATGWPRRSSTSSAGTTGSTTRRCRTSCGSIPGVHLHVHFAPVHRAPGVLRHVASAEVGAAMLFNPVAPEAAAQLLRDA